MAGRRQTVVPIVAALIPPAMRSAGVGRPYFHGRPRQIVDGRGSERAAPGRASSPAVRLKVTPSSFQYSRTL
jgi:hypothetical protein